LLNVVDILKDTMMQKKLHGCICIVNMTIIALISTRQIQFTVNENPGRQ